MPYNEETVMETYKKRLDIQNLRRIFSYGRPASSELENYWVNKYLFTPEMQAMGMYKDGFEYGRQKSAGIEGEGNLIIEVGEGSETLFSSHTDTVHRTGVMQNVFIETADKPKFETDSGQCLGGDDGTGVWLMLELIKAGVPGLYIFHRAEEVGGQGSSYIANTTPELIQGYKRAIAFDRKDDWSIITHQAGVRTCSDEFAKDLGEKLGMGHKGDSTGSFTDTANYDNIIPECTNLSVGYHNAHSARENQEVDYLLKFRDALIEVDWENLVTARDPSEPEYSTSGYYGYGDRLLKPKKKVRDKMGWGDWEDQQFEKSKAKEEAKKEAIEEEEGWGDVILGEDYDWRDDIQDIIVDMNFLEKGIQEMNDDEYFIYEQIQDGVLLEEELANYLNEGMSISQIRGIFLDDHNWPDEYLDKINPKKEKTKEDEEESIESDPDNQKDSDFDWDGWFVGWTG